jgi:hypothetical protein
MKKALVVLFVVLVASVAHAKNDKVKNDNYANGKQDVAPGQDGSREKPIKIPARVGIASMLKFW